MKKAKREGKRTLKAAAIALEGEAEMQPTVMVLGGRYRSGASHTPRESDLGRIQHT